MNWRNNPYIPRTTKPIHIKTLLMAGGEQIGYTGISNRPVIKMTNGDRWAGGLDNDGAMYWEQNVHVNREPIP